jgi:integrase
MIGSRLVMPKLSFGILGRDFMAGIVIHARLESASARARLKSGRQAHWQAIIEGRVHLGYQRWKGDPEGRWILRRYIRRNVYRTLTLGRADDDASANGGSILNYEQAEAKARALVDAPTNRVHRLTVRTALDRYVEFKRSAGQSTSDVLSRGWAHIIPPLGDLVVSELTPEVLRRWLATLAASPAQNRPKAGKLSFRPEPKDDDDVRRRRASANRVLTMLKAALNHAYDEGHVPSRDAWGRKLKPFRDVEVARVRYLQVAQAQRLMNAADPDFRPLLRAALETGARYSELTRWEVADFNADAGTLAIRKSKSGKARHVVLTDEGAVFFQAHVVGKSGHELMFGREWRKSEQARPMREACLRAKITPPIGFHQLRHTWASLAVMNGVPLMVVAKNLGHVDTGMVEKHYGHLAPSFIADAIRAGAPRFGITATNVAAISLRSGRKAR